MAIIPTYHAYLLFQMYVNPPEFEFQGTIRKRKIISSLLVYVLRTIKHEIRHFHVVIIVQK